MIFAILLLIFTIFYCLAVIFVGYLLSRSQKTMPFGDTFVSIIIAARNEAKRIKPAIDSLQYLNYPKHLYEVIWVDDNSEDETADILSKTISENENWHLIRLGESNPNLKGKKQALRIAIGQAKGEIILTTDADCRVQKNWIRSVLSAFDADTAMVLGHSLLERTNDITGVLLRFDNLFSAIMVAAPALAGFPISSVGRNMAYRKDAYEGSGGYDKLLHFKSGDDVHLTELFRQKVKGKITFCASGDSFTYTQPPEKLSEILHQQIRKNSKLLKKSVQSILLTAYLFLYHAGLIAFPFIIPDLFDFWLFLVGLKLISEFIVLAYSSVKFKEKGLILFIPFMQLFYPVYVIILALTGSLQIFKWKDRI